MLSKIILSIVQTFRINTPIVDSIFSIIDFLRRIQCNETFPCDYPTSDISDPEFGALPVATRCWADFTADIDASNAFSCTPSDTCRVSDLDYGTTLNEYGNLVDDGNQIVCDSCPLQPGGLINQFGCDTYTKQCTCNR